MSKIEKPEKIVGYVLLVVGLVVVIIPTYFGISIVFIYTLVGFIVGLAKVDLVRLVSSHWLPNIIFFLIFLVLAFSFFGMFEITLPGSWSKKAPSSRFHR